MRQGLELWIFAVAPLGLWFGEALNPGFHPGLYASAPLGLKTSEVFGAHPASSAKRRWSAC